MALRWGWIEAGRKRKIETFVAMLARGETLYPQMAKPQRGSEGP